MTTLRTRRRSVVSRYPSALFGWRGWQVTPTQVPVTNAGQAGTFTRNSTAWAVDSTGRLYQVPIDAPAVHTHFSAAGVALASGILTGPAAANTVTNPDDMTTGSGWTLSEGGPSGEGSSIFRYGVGESLSSATFARTGDARFNSYTAATITSSYSGALTLAGRPFTTITSSTVGATNRVSRAITITAASPAFCFLIRKRSDSPTQASGRFTVVAVRDITAGTTRGAVRVCWNGETPVVTATLGATILHTAKLANGYLIVARAASVVSGNSHEVAVAPANTSAYEYASIAGSVDIAGVTVVNGPQLAVPYGVGAVTKLRFDIDFLPRALTAYVDYVSLGAEAAVSANVLFLGDSASDATTPRLFLNNNTSEMRWFLDPAGTTPYAAPALPSYGQRVRTIAVIDATGVVTNTRQYDSGTALTNTPTAAQGIPSAWAGGASAVLAIGEGSGGGNPACMLVQAVGIASGARTIAQMETVL